ncbi:monovalent cation/H(+) antiporter subunit G [Paenibacillus agaridevorans]|uniref:monovalent cation/H(+) antiporter subunit G n=1 Tax=Paenibacillus agaridevorans TaxID=171404 RepID=UPI001FE6085E|nr:monovalent cation/H(+) antiporter subunit G [Paenibacillus agaridevorans]
MTGRETIESIVVVMVLIGTVLSLLSSLGFLRFPDVYTRSHAATKSITLGILFILLATFLYFLFVHEQVSVRLLLGIIFVFLTAPVTGHLIARSAYRYGVKPSGVQDELAADLEKAKKRTTADDRT